MARQLGQLAFGGIGAMFGGQFGFSIGMTIGGMLFGQKPPKSKLQKLRLSTTQPGSMLPLAYGGIFPGETRGGVRSSGIFIDCSPDGGIVSTSDDASGGTAGAPKTSGGQINKLTCSLAFADARAGACIVDEIYLDNKLKANRFGKTDKKKGWFSDLVTEQAPNGMVISEIGSKVEVHRGTWWQQPSATMQQIHAGKPLSAHRGIPLIVFKGIEIESIPTITVVYRNNITNCRRIVRLHMRISSVPADVIDLCAITGNIRGVFQNSVGGADELVLEVAEYSDCGVSEWDGKIKDYSLIVPPAKYVQVPRADLATRVSGSGGSGDSGGGGKTSRLKENFDSSARPATHFGINFSDIERNYDSSEAPSERHTAGYFKSESIEVGIVSKMAEMLPRARIMHDRKWLERDTREVLLPWKYLRVSPGMVLQVEGAAIEEGAAPATFMVKGQGLGRVLTMRGTTYDASIWNKLDGGAPLPSISVPEVAAYDTPTLFLADPPALTDAERAIQSGRLIAAASADSASDWAGAAILWNTQTTPAASGALWAGGLPSQTTLPQRAAMGVLLDALSSTRPDFDYGVKIRVQLLSGNLADATEDYVLRGANRALVKDPSAGAFGGGARAVQWTRATQISTTPNIWELSGLLVGRFGTEYIETSPVGALFLLVADAQGRQAPGLARVEVPFALLGKPLNYVIASGDSDGGRSATQQVVCNGLHLKELAPTLQSSTRNETGDLTLVWNERTRNNADGYWKSGAAAVATGTSFTIELTNALGAVIHSEVVIGTTMTLAAATLATAVSGTIRQNGARGLGFALKLTNL